MTRSIVYVTNFLLSAAWFLPMWCDINEFNICHDNFDLDPEDGILEENTFPWLGFAQHIHGLIITSIFGFEITGLLHPTKAPRVVLIHRQFVLATAKDMLKLPKHYKLGNVIFGEYEREEEDCGLTSEDVLMGYKCQLAYIEMPLVDILPHPEYSRFGVKNSLALARLLRPMKSSYMMSVCFPTIKERRRMKHNNIVFLVDYMSTVPRDFKFERMGKKTLKLLVYRNCSRIFTKTIVDIENLAQILCSSGCGMRPDAPIITHAVDGRFELVGQAWGGSPCRNRDMRSQFNNNPPFYMDVYPYVPWIINVITAHTLPKPYPQNFKLVHGGPRLGTVRSHKKVKSGWNGRTYLWGDRCFSHANSQKEDLFFYRENFSIQTKADSFPFEVNITLQVSVGPEVVLACFRLVLPHRKFKLIITIESLGLTLAMPLITYKNYFSFSIGITGRNISQLF